MAINRILYSIIITCAVAFQATAQVALFNKTYDDYNAWEVVDKIHENDDSTILVLSNTIDVFATDSTKYGRFYLSMLSKNGAIIDKKIFAYPSSDYNNLFEFGKFNNELFAILGFVNTDTLISNERLKVKGFYLQSSGDTARSVDVALKTFDGTKPGFGPIISTSKGTFLTIASYNSAFADSLYFFSSDSNGNILWVKEHPEIRNYVTNAIETPDKGFILSGKENEDQKYKWSSDGLELIYIGHPERLWYAKIDSIGNLQWQKLLTGDYYELYDTIYHKYRLSYTTTFRSAIKTADGNYLMAGRIVNQPYMAKVNEQGERLWQSKYFKHLSYLDTLRRQAFFMNIKEVDGYIYALGYIDSLEQDSDNTIPYVFLMKLTGTGRTIWTRYFRVGNDYLYAVTPCKGGFFLTGSKRDTTPNKYGNQDGWIMKVDEYGCLIPGCQLNDVIDTSTAVSEIEKDKIRYLLFPNPATHTLNLQSDQAGKNTSYIIYDYSGRQMLSGKLSSSQTINIQQLPMGFYIIELQDQAASITRQKFLKE